MALGVLELPGTSGNVASTADSAALLSITGDMDVRVRVAPVDWTPAAIQSFAAKHQPAGNQRGWSFDLDTAGKFQFLNSDDGLGTTTVTSSVATGFADGAVKWVRVTFRASDGRVQFFTADGSIVTPVAADFTQLGTNQTTGRLSLFDNTASLIIGGRITTTQLMPGLFYRVQIRSGIDGTLVYDARFDNVTATASKTPTNFVESSGNGYTVFVLGSGSWRWINVEFTGTDTGAGADAGSNVGLPGSDTGAGAEAGSLAAAATAAETGAGADAGSQVGLSVDDTGAGADAGSLLVSITDAETGSAALLMVHDATSSPTIADQGTAVRSWVHPAGDGTNVIVVGVVVDAANSVLSVDLVGGFLKALFLGAATNGNVRVELWAFWTPAHENPGGLAPIDVTLAAAGESLCFADSWVNGSRPGPIVAATGAGAPTTVTAPGVVRGFVADVAGWDSAAPAPSAGAGQTGVVDHATGLTGASSYEAGAGSTVMDWTGFAGAPNWAQLALVLPAWGEDSTLEASAEDTDAAAGADAGSIAAALADAETAAGDDAATPTIVLASAESGTGSDADAQSAAVVDPETGSTLDAGSTLAALSDASSGVSVDDGSVVALASAAETSSGLDAAALAAALTDTDTGSGVDDSMFDAPFPVVDSDTGAGVDASSPLAALSTPDTATGLDVAGSLAAEAGSPDVGSGGDAAAVLAALTQDDTGSGVDQGGVLRELTDAELAVGLEGSIRVDLGVAIDVCIGAIIGEDRFVAKIIEGRFDADLDERWSAAIGESCVSST